MFNFDYIAKEDIEDRLYRILIVGVSGSGITIALLTLISNKTGIDRTYLYGKDPFKAKYNLLTN